MIMVTRCHMNVTFVKKFSTPQRILKSIDWHIKKLEVAELTISSGDFVKLVTWRCLSCIVFKTSSKISFLLLYSTQPHSQPSPRPVPAGGQDSPNFKCSLLWLSLLTFLGDHNAALLAGPISTFVVHCRCCCYLVVLLSILQCWWLSGSDTGYPAVLLAFWQCC